MSKYISGIKSPAFSVDTNGILSTSTTISGTNTIPGVSMGLNTNTIAALELTSASNSGQSYIDFTHTNQDYGGRILYDHSLNELALFTNANTSAEVYINNLGNMGIGGRSITYPLEINGHVQAKNGSFHTTGATGWYNDTYGSGWYMVDTTAVRVFADKHIATAGNIYITNVNPTGVINLLNNHGINFQTNSTANKINFDAASNLLVYDTSAIHNFYINTVLQTSISTLGITIPNGNALYTTNIDSLTSSNVAVGYYTPKQIGLTPTFNVYNNNINRVVLFAVNSGGTSGGSDNVTVTPPFFVNNAINIKNGSGVENLIQNLSAASASPLNIYMPNLSIGNFNALRVGIGSSLNNTAEFRFLNVGSGSVLNSVSVAFYGNNNMYTVTAGGIHTFTGTSATYQIPLILNSTLSCTTINTNNNTITAGQINSGNISTTSGIHVSSYLAPNTQGGTYSWNRDTNSGYTCFTNQQGAGSGGYEFLHCDSLFNIMSGKFVMDSVGNASTTATFTCNTLRAATAGINNASPQYTLDVVGDIMARSAFLRTTGNTGWYNDTYSGGWYMTDTTAVRVYGDKHIYTAGNLFGQNLILTGNLAISTVGTTENYIQNMSTTSGSVLNMTMPNLVNGNSSLLRIGANNNSCNCAEIRFLYNSSGNTSNAYSIGFFGYGNLYNLTAAGVHSFTGTSASFSVPINTNNNNIMCGGGVVIADKLITNSLTTQGGPITCGQINATYVYISGNIGINTTSPGYSLDIIGQLRTQGGFLRTTGSTGWYNETYTSGWYMIDTTAVRVYNDKHIATAGNIYITNVNPTGIINLQNDQAINFQTNSTTNKIRYDSVNALLAYDTSGIHKFFINSVLEMTINTLGVTIPNGNSLYTTNIDSATGNVAIGYATLKQSAVYPTFTVYNNSTNRNILFAVNTGGTSSGNDNIQINTPLFVNSAMSVVNANQNTIQNTNTSSACPLTVYVPNLATNNLSVIRTGVSDSNNNAVEFKFTYVGAGSVGNILGLGFYGSDSLYKVTSYGIHTFTGIRVNFNIPISTTSDVTIGSGTLNANTIYCNGLTANAISAAGNITVQTGITIYTQNIDSTTGSTTIGYNSIKQSAEYAVLNVYNNYSSRNLLLSINSAGYNSGSNNIQIYTLLNTNDNNITCGNGSLTAGVINATTNMNTPSIHVNNFVLPNVQGGTYTWNRTGSGGLTCFTNQQGTGTGGYEFLHYDSSFNLLPGRITMDNSGNATLTGQLNCASLFASNGTGTTENLMQNQVTTPGSILNLMMPNLDINNYTLLRNGVSITANNCAEFRFIYAGSGNAANTAGLGFFGSQPIYTYTVAGIHTFTGSSAVFNVPITAGSISGGSISCRDINTNGYDISCYGILSRGINNQGFSLTTGNINCYGSINTNGYDINCINNGTVTASNISVVNLSVTGIFNISSISCHDINTNGYNITCGGGIVSANSILCNGVNTQNNRITCGPITCYDIDTQNNGITCGGVNTNAINCTTVNTNGLSNFNGGSAPNLWCNAYCNGVGIASTGGTGSSTLCAIFSTWALFESGWYVRSDNRIKMNIITITDEEKILTAINPCTYMHIDKKKCDVKKYGLIAQEVEKIIPEAINISTDVIPNTMKLAKKISIRSFELDQDLHIGLVRLYVSNEGKNVETKIDCNIIARSNNVYIVDTDITKDIVFVYGEFVHDVKSIDYNAFISILIAGYKTQANEIKNQDARIKRLEELFT